ncbi:transposase, MuDR, MULE transposase domain protein [Tanacetum coccineum]
MKVMITLCLSTFFVGQTFSTAAEVKERVRLHSIETRRKLFLAKNDKVRNKAKCLGRILVFTLDGEWPSNTEEVAPTKKRTKVKGKKDVGLSDPVVPIKKGVSLGGRGRPQPLAANKCPWDLQITKFLSKGIVDQIKKNPDILVKALQDELQKKYELGVSRQKAFRAKSASLLGIIFELIRQNMNETR